MEGNGFYPEETDVESLGKAKKRFLVDEEFVSTLYSRSKKETLLEAIEGPLTLCVGKPGTGKTFTIKSLINDGVVKGRVNAIGNENRVMDSIVNILSGGREVKDKEKYLKRIEPKVVCIDEASFLTKEDYEKIRTASDETNLRLILVYHEPEEIEDTRMISRILTKIEFEGLDFPNFKYYVGYRSKLPHAISLVPEEKLKEAFEEIQSGGRTSFREANKFAYALFDVMESIFKYEGEVEFKRSVSSGKAVRMALIHYAKHLKVHPDGRKKTKEET